MDKLQHKKNYWKNGKLCHVLQDDTVSSLDLLYFLDTFHVYSYINFNVTKTNISSEKTAMTF